MKQHSVKALPLILALILALSLLGGCGSSSTPAPQASAPASQPTVTEQPKEATTPVPAASPADEANGTDTPSEANESAANVLVVYFSHTGTTREVAAYLHEVVGGDLVEIIPETAYPEGYSAALDPAKAEQRENARPAINKPLESIDQYEVIYLGYPIWWGTVPMIINTFLESYDFTGKTVVPFATSGGTGIGQSVKDIRNEVPGAEVPDGLLVRSNDAILPWLQGLGLSQ